MTLFRDIFLFATVGRHGTVRLRIADEPQQGDSWSLQSRLARGSEEQDPSMSWSFNLRDLAPGVLEFFASSRTRPQLSALSPTVITQASGLWRSFVDGALRQKIANVRESSSEGIRVNIIGASTSIWNTPWEWLEASCRELFPDIQIVVSRAVPMHFSPPPLRIEGQVRLLTLPSNPKDERKMNIFEELASIPTPVLALRENAVSARRSDVQSHVLAFRPNIIHYVGHAGVDGEEGNLILESDYIPESNSHSSDWVSPREFQPLLAPSVRLLCLATCVTVPNYDIRGFAAFALGDSVSSFSNLPSIVFTQLPISQQSSSAFWGRFYRELIENGNDLTSAVNAGRDEVRVTSPNSVEWSSFVLVLREQLGTDAGRPFNITPQAAPLPGIVPPSEESRTAGDLQTYFASQLANALESLQSSDLPVEVSQKIKSQVDEARNLIQE